MMKFLSIKSIFAFIIILYIIEVALVASSKPVGEDYFNPTLGHEENFFDPMLKHENVRDIKVYPMYMDDVAMLKLTRTGSWAIFTMQDLAALFQLGVLNPGNNSVESWEFTTPEGNVTYVGKSILGLNSFDALYRCSEKINPRMGEPILEGWGVLGAYYPFLDREYYSASFANKFNSKNNDSAYLAEKYNKSWENITVTPEEAWRNYTESLESEKEWALYISNILEGYTPSKDIRAIYYYGYEGKLIADTQLFSDEELKNADLLVDGVKRNFWTESGVLIADVGRLESGRHSVELRAGGVSKKMDFDVRWTTLSEYKLLTNGTLYLQIINMRNESISIKKFVVNDMIVDAEQQLPAFGEGLVYNNESNRFFPPTYNISLQVPEGGGQLGDCNDFKFLVEYSMPDGRNVTDEWEDFGLKVEV